MICIRQGEHPEALLHPQAPSKSLGVLATKPGASQIGWQKASLSCQCGYGETSDCGYPELQGDRLVVPLRFLLPWLASLRLPNKCLLLPLWRLQ